MAAHEPGRFHDNKRQFHAIVKRAHDIRVYREKIAAVTNDESMEALQRYRSLTQLGESATHLLVSEKHYIQEMLRRVEAIIAGRRRAAPELPSIETIRAELHEFQNGKQPLVPVPYPALCGAMPLPRDQIIPRGSFACVPQDGGYILAYVLWFDPETNSYHVCDAEPQGDSVVEFVVPADQVLPLPTSSPARRSKATTHPVDAKVLALWPDENGTWTSVFYSAVVLTQPTTSPGWYHLQFESTDDDSAPYFADVPERYIVLAPED